MAYRLVVAWLCVAATASACVSLSPTESRAPITPTTTVAPSSTPASTAPPTGQPPATPLTPTVAPATASAPPATPAQTLTGRIVNAEYGYAVTLPEGWIALSADSDFGELLKQALRSDPRVLANCRGNDQSDVERCIDAEVAELQSLFESFEQAGAILAFDIASVFETVPRLMVALRTPGGFGITNDLFLLIGEERLREQGARGRIQSDLVDIPAGEAVRFIWNAPRNMARNGVAYQYHLISGEFVYSVVIVGRRGSQALPEVADSIARSLEILPTQ